MMETTDRLHVVCKELGLADDVVEKILTRLRESPSSDVLRQYKNMIARETEIMALLGTKAPEKIIHDLRNVLNEVVLLRAAAKFDD